jgi:tetratricopeptide (TPR) repeat protein
MQLRLLGAGLAALLAPVIGMGMPTEARSEWVEVRSGHFVVASNAGAMEARSVAERFEQVRAIFQGAFPKFRVDGLQPMVILAARDEATMKTLAPEDWQQETHLRPAGLFHSDGEKDYVVLRLDAEGTSTFHTILHEYTHALVFLNLKKLPLWLSEGLAEFFANSTVGEKGVRTGTADKTHLWVLDKNEWLPVETLLTVTDKSPYYNENNPASIFYSESWAAVHYLLTDPEAQREQLLSKYLAAWERSKDPVEAGRDTFGDLQAIAEKVRKHVRGADWRTGIALPVARDVTAKYTERDLSTGEVLALRGDLLVHRGQLDAAEPVLEEAVKNDPGSAMTHEALGLLHFRDGDFEDADEEMSQAIELGSKDFMTFYCHGSMLLRMPAGSEDSEARAVAALEKAARLNPQYAPTFEALTQAYSRSGETKEKALEAARKAAELDPEARTYQFALAYMLLNNGKAAEAGDVAQKLLATASSDDEVQPARRLMATIEEEKEWEKESAEEEANADPPMEGAVKGGVGASAGGASARPAIAKRQLPTPEWMALDGEITAMSCEKSPEITITLAMPKGPMGFHAADFRHVGTRAASAQAVPGLESCKQWVGRRVKIWFRWVQGQEWVGEMTKLYFF